MLKTQALEPELDPYSRLISGSVERVGPGVAGIEARSASGRPRGTGSGVIAHEQSCRAARGHRAGVAVRWPHLRSGAGGRWLRLSCFAAAGGSP